MKELALDQEHHHQLAHDEQDVTARPILRRAARPRERDGAGPSASTGGDAGVAGIFSTAINAGLGHALPDNLRETFETSLGTSLADVRVHTDGTAAASADAFDAHAFAHGQNIFFGAGQYRPGTPDGDQLIAHEVAHTVQQRGAAPTTQHKLAISEPGDAMEHAADAAALAMTRGERTGVGSAGLTVARQSRGATQAQPAANGGQPAANAAAGARTIAQLFPQGITVAVTHAVENVDARAQRIEGRRQSLRHEVTAGGLLPQLPGGNRGTVGVRRALELPEHTITHQEAVDLATALCANDAEFGRRSADFVATHQVVGGDPSAPRVGAPLMFDHGEHPVEQVRTLSRTVGQLPGATTPGNIRHLAIFTHGGHHGLDLAGSAGGAQAFVSQLSGALTRDVTVGLYACNAASGDSHGQSFAQDVAEGLAHDGHDARVFGHEDAANAATNPRGREYVAHAGQATATTHSNYELVFDPAYRSTQITDLARHLPVPAAEIERVFNTASRHWLMAAMPRIHMTGRPISAAFQMGFDPGNAVSVCRNAWETEGPALIAQALHLPASSIRGAAAPAPVAAPASAHASENRMAAPADIPEDRAIAPAARATVPEHRASAAASPKPAMDPHAKDKAPMAPHAKDPVAPTTSAPANAAPSTAAPAAEGPLAVVQRPGPLHPRHPGDGMALRADHDGHAARVESIPAGTFVHIVRREGDWTLVRHRGVQGYVPSANIHEVSVGQQDVRDEAEYHLAAAETQNNAAQYTPDSARVNLGLGSWTGGRIGRLLERYRRFAEQRGQVEALYSHFVNREHFDDLVHRFWTPDMSERVIQTPEGPRTWHGPTLDADEITQFRTAEAQLPFIRDADQDQIHSDVDRYLGWLGRSAYPFIAADRTVSEAALNVAISAYHQGGMHIAAANAHFGAALAQTSEIDYLTYLGSLVHPHTQGRYRQIVSQYADSPRRYPVP